MSVATRTRFPELDTLRERIDRLFAEFVAWPRDGIEKLAMPVDIQETEHELTVIASLPGIKAEDLQRNIARHLLELVQELRSGAYRPDALRQFPVAKGDGRTRVLSALTLRDKLAQRAVLTVLDPIGESIFHHDSFGYRPRRNVQMAVARVRERIRCGLTWLVDADIRSFFDTIPHRPLRRAVARVVDDREILRLIDQWLAAGTYQTGILTGPRGIPQGAVVSPFLCNVYLHGLDSALAERNIPFVRYADDFIAFAADQATAKSALDFTRRRLENLGLELHPEKTRVVQAGPHVAFLGERLPAGARVRASPRTGK
jgi:group II intron reverse transcriptase/maturase